VDTLLVDTLNSTSDFQRKNPNPTQNKGGGTGQDIRLAHIVLQFFSPPYTAHAEA